MTEKERKAFFSAEEHWTVVEQSYHFRLLRLNTDVADLFRIEYLGLQLDIDALTKFEGIKQLKAWVLDSYAFMESGALIRISMTQALRDLKEAGL